MKSKQIGDRGEDFSVEFLSLKGYTILQRNYFSRYGEIDIIAAGFGRILFVEVKTRKSSSMVSATQSVTPAKQGKIVKTALIYLQDNPVDLQPRFDVCEVMMFSDGSYKVEYYENAFDADIY